MPHTAARRKTTKRVSKNSANAKPSRYTVGLVAPLAHSVENYADSAKLSMSKAIAALVRLGLESQERRKREFFDKLKGILDDDTPEHRDRMVEEFRDLILGQ
ncbi:MAG TPA: hypothetical protein VGL53_22445 [Bryobacteraceae bacterium]|jgi:hypothetical protein